jgi:hypothetical protein
MPFSYEGEEVCRKRRWWWQRYLRHEGFGGAVIFSKKINRSEENKGIMWPCLPEASGR